MEALDDDHHYHQVDEALDDALLFFVCTLALNAMPKTCDCGAPLFVEITWFIVKCSFLD